MTTQTQQQINPPDFRGLPPDRLRHLERRYLLLLMVGGVPAAYGQAMLAAIRQAMRQGGRA